MKMMQPVLGGSGVDFWIEAPPREGRWAMMNWGRPIAFNVLSRFLRRPQLTSVKII